MSSAVGEPGLRGGDAPSGLGGGLGGRGGLGHRGGPEPGRRGSSVPCYRGVERSGEAD